MTPQQRKNFESIRDNVHGEPMTQRQWVGLTEKEQDAIFKTFSRSEAHKLNFLNRIASAVEAKLKEKNT